MRYALLIYRDEETAVSDRERQHREEQFTETLDGPRGRGALADTQQLLPARAARLVRCWDGGDIIVTGSSAIPGNSSPAGSSPSAKTWTAPSGWPPRSRPRGMAPSRSDRPARRGPNCGCHQIRTPRRRHTPPAPQAAGFARVPSTTRQHPASPETSWNDAGHLSRLWRAACVITG